MSGYNPEYQRKYRARKRAEKAVTPVKSTPSTLPSSSLIDESIALTTTEPEDELTLEMESSVPGKPLTFRERMAAKVKSSIVPAGGTTKKKRTSKVEINFLTKALPMITGLLASYAESFYPDPYKSCAPKREEVVAILGPIFNIIERRIQITGQMSEDSIDLLASGMALIGFIGRSYISYADIKKANEGTLSHGQETRKSTSIIDSPSSAQPDSLTNFGRASTEGTLSGHSGDYTGQPSGNDYELSTFNDAEIFGGDVSANDTADISYQRDLVAFALKQDAQYRSRNGLL